MGMSINSAEATAKFAEKAFGNTYEDSLKAVNMSDYLTEEAYLAAVTKHHLEHSSPEYRQAYSGVKAAFEEKKNAEQKANFNKRYDELKKTSQLDYMDERKADTQAKILADEDLRSGKITTSQYASTIKAYRSKEEQKIKAGKASNSLMNEIFRSGR